jgi:3-oxocholest-4-en-26-oate---CoA ligase
MEFNLADLYEAIADVIGDRIALVSGDQRWSYATLDEQANRLANFLKTRGVKPGCHVGLHLYNDTQFVVGMLAAFKLRSVPINLNYRYVAHELRYLCENADLVTVISQRKFAPIVAEAIAGVEQLSTVIFVDDGSEVADPPGLPVFDYQQVLEQSSPVRDFGPRSGKDLYIIYTGGTTGMPKGVMWQHEDLFFAGLQGGNPGGDPIATPEGVPENAKDGYVIMLPCAPFIHGAAQFAAWIAFLSGGTVVLQNGPSFNAQRICQLIQEEQVNTLTLVGDAMALPIGDELGSGTYNTESLVAIASAGAVLSPSVRDRLQKLVPDSMVINSFGASETGHQGSAIPGEETGVQGRPSFFMDESNTVLDEDYKPIAPGSGIVGKLARRKHIPLGYYKDPVKTAERFVVLGDERWSIPGDFATIEEDGRITIFGRGSFCINTGGEKVFPEEVEEALKSHPDVFDALVIGVDDERWMQRVAAVVQPRKGCTPTLAVLQAHCRQVIAGYKIPRQLSVVERVERFPSGKPDYIWAKKQAMENITESHARTSLKKTCRMVFDMGIR